MLHSGLSLSVRRPVRLSLWSSGLGMLVRVLSVCWQSCFSARSSLGLAWLTHVNRFCWWPFSIFILWQQGHLYLTITPPLLCRCPQLPSSQHTHIIGRPCSQRTPATIDASL